MKQGRVFAMVRRDLWENVNVEGSQDCGSARGKNSTQSLVQHYEVPGHSQLIGCCSRLCAETIGSVQLIFPLWGEPVLS